MNNLASKKKSLLKYYQENEINPVVIRVENKDVWKDHEKKRQNLYTNHLKIPLTFFQHRSILEFGCNSGENALYLASLGASLTLIEPNSQVLPRLKDLFRKFGLEKSIENLENKEIEKFVSKKSYDMVVAEGFLHTLQNRDEMLIKICSLLSPGGIGVVSFDDRYGSLSEMLRALLLQRVCQLRKIENLNSESCIETAQELFLEDFKRLNASRDFVSWCLDNLVNLHTSWESFWTYQQIIPLIEKAGCQFYSSSPGWSDIDNYLWYKNVFSIKDRHLCIIEDWKKNFVFFLTGFPLTDRHVPPATQSIVNSVSGLIGSMSEFCASSNYDINSLQYPKELEEYLSDIEYPDIRDFNKCLKSLFAIIKSNDERYIIDNYHSLEGIRNVWGSALHYICFARGI